MLKSIISASFEVGSEMEMNKGLNIHLPRSRLSYRKSSIFRQWKLWAAALFFLNFFFWTFQLVRYANSRTSTIPPVPNSSVVFSVIDVAVSSTSERLEKKILENATSDANLQPASGAIAQPERPPEESKSARLAHDSQQLASELVWSWHSAWSKQDFKGYIETYSPEYAPPGISREQWANQRQLMIENKKFINIKIQDMSANLNGNLLTATFRMDYLSDSYMSSSEKALTFRQENGKWLIVKEVTKG